MNGPAPMDDWRTLIIDGVTFVTCPVCGAVLNHRDTQALARHVLWHHNLGQWPWERMRR